MLVLALDPGATVGWASHNSENAQWQSGQMPLAHLWASLDSFAVYTGEPAITIVYEKVDPDELRAIDLVLPECVGIIKEWARQFGNARLFEQTAAQAKFFWTDDRIKQYGLYKPNRQHAMDALRHLLYYIHFTLREPLPFAKEVTT